LIITILLIMTIKSSKTLKEIGFENASDISGVLESMQNSGFKVIK